MRTFPARIATLLPHRLPPRLRSLLLPAAVAAAIAGVLAAEPALPRSGSASSTGILPFPESAPLSARSHAGLVGGAAREPEDESVSGPLLQRYTNVMRLIETAYAREIPPETLARATVSGMLSRLDPHSNLFVPRTYRQMRERQQGEYVGLGIRVQQQNGLLTVVSPFEGTPAYRLGIRAGDVISRIEGEDATQYDMDQAVSLLRGPRGTPVNITITRPGYDAPLDFTVVRDRIPLRSVPYYFTIEEPGTGEKSGYVRISDFNENTGEELGEAIVELRLRDATRLIVDLRHNPGGLLNQAIAVSNVFLKQGAEIVSIRGRDDRRQQVFLAEEPSPHGDLPLIVLVSRESASASEIVAGAVQDHDRGLILGENTYGKGLVQSVYPLPHGYALGLTSAQYFTPSGRRLQRDYDSGDFLDYYRGRGERDSNDEAGTIVRTALGREIEGGGGIAPDLPVAAPEPAPALVRMEQHGAFFRFATRFVPKDGRGAVDGAGKRPDELEARGDLIRAVDQEFRADRATLDEFLGFLEEEGIPRELPTEDAARRRVEEQIALRIEGEVFSLLWGPGASRRATIDRDPQVNAALAAMPRAALLLEDPEGYLAETASASGNE